MSATDIVLRIILSIFFGGVIGYEREMRNRPAGFITHILVCVGACIVSLIQVKMIEDVVIAIEIAPVLASALKADIGRVVGQVITGVGFLGAGAIIFNKGSVKGLTTAATVWVVACIGLAIGLGYYVIGIISAMGIIFIIVFLKKFESFTKNRKFSMVLELTYSKDNQSFIESMLSFFAENEIAVRDITIPKGSEGENKRCCFNLYIGILKSREELIEELAKNQSIVSIKRK